MPEAWTGDDEDNLPLPGKPLTVVPAERSVDNEFELPLFRIMCSVPEDERRGFVPEAEISLLYVKMLPSEDQTVVPETSIGWLLVLEGKMLVGRMLVM